jgi:hypothetical protein
MPSASARVAEQSPCHSKYLIFRTLRRVPLRNLESLAGRSAPRGKK